MSNRNDAVVFVLFTAMLSGSATAVHGGTCIPPSFTTEAEDQTVCEGESVVLIVTPVGSPPMALQWLLDGDALADETAFFVVLSPTMLADAGNYQCRVENPCGLAVTQPAVLTVLPDALSIIDEQPEDMTVPEGDPAIFCVGATHASDFQWFVNGAPIAGATESCLAIPSVTPDDEGSYTVEVSNFCHTAGGIVVSDPATLTVIPACNGDFDSDGDVDLVDFGVFQLCFTGAGGGPVDSDCACSDFDADGDVDLADFGNFQLVFTGAI